MEHRCSIRKPVRLSVLLYKHGLPVQGGVCRDLGLGGIFVECAGYAWRRNEYLQVELIGAGGVSAMRLPAVVVHHGEQGAGLMFDAIGAEQRRELRALLARIAVDRQAAEDGAAAKDPRAVA